MGLSDRQAKSISSCIRMYFALQCTHDVVQHPTSIGCTPSTSRLPICGFSSVVLTLMVESMSVVMSRYAVHDGTIFMYKMYAHMYTVDNKLESSYINKNGHNRGDQSILHTISQSAVRKQS